MSLSEGDAARIARHTVPAVEAIIQEAVAHEVADTLLDHVHRVVTYELNRRFLPRQFTFTVWRWEISLHRRSR